MKWRASQVWWGVWCERMNKEAQNLQTQPRETSGADAGPMATVSRSTARALVNRSPAHLVLLDADDKIIDANERTERLLGKSADELRGSELTGVFKEIVGRVNAIGQERAEQGFQILHEKAWYEVQVFETFEQGDGESIEANRVIRATEVTDRKESEFELLESEARLEEATRIARMGTYKLYWDTMKSIWSHQMYDIHGLNPGTYDPAQPGYNDYVHPEDQHIVEDLVKGLVSGKESSGFEYRIIRGDGQTRWVRLDGRVLFDAEGKSYATFGTLQDITDAKERERELEELVSRNTILTEALQASPVGVAILTAESEEPTIFYVNAALELISGHADGSLIGSSLTKLQGQETDSRIFEQIIQAIKTSQAKSFEVSLHRQDGTAFLAQIDVAPVVSNRGSYTVAHTLIVRDITDDRRRADAMMESQKMEALGKLSGGVAHEINNLLQPIITLSDLGKEAVDTKEEKLLKYFDVIAGSGRKAREVVRQILTFSRQDAPAVGAHEVEPIVHDATQLAKSGLPPGIELETHLAVDDARALLNPTQMSQVVINLIRNAADAMETGGTIKLLLEKLDEQQVVTAELPNRGHPWMRLSVEDSGCGISDETRARIFEPFFTTKPVGKGTGLGLSVVYSIVLGWGGSIDIESEVDRGTTAMVYIPEFLE